MLTYNTRLEDMCGPFKIMKYIYIIMEDNEMFLK